MATIYTPKFGRLDFVGNDYGDIVTEWNFGNTNATWAFSVATYANPEKTQISGMAFIPEDYIMKGALSGTTQYSTPKLLNKKFLEDLYTQGQAIDVAGLDPNLERKLQQDGYSTKGVLVSGKFFWDNINNKNFDYNFYDVNDPQQDGRLGGEILGMSEIDGNLVYARRPTGKNTQTSYLAENGYRYTTYKKYKYGSFGEFVGGALEAFAGIPFAPEILFAITKNPVVYATAKGLQVAGSGGDVEDTLKAYGTAWITASISKNPFVQNIGATIAPAATASVQAIIGSSVTNAAVSGVLASIRGADVNKSILAGATTGALSASANDFTSALLGGTENVAAIGSAFNLTPEEVATIFTGAFSDGVVASIKDQDFLQEFTNSLISRGIGQTVANEVNQKLITTVGRDRLSDITNVSKQVATIASDAALNNQNVEDAIKNAVPGILISITTANQLREQEKQERERVAALTTEQENLLAQIEEAAQREFGAVEEPLQFAQFGGGTATDAISKLKIDISGKPFIAEDAPQGLQLPPGFRVATLDEVSAGLAGSSAFELENGQSAWLIQNDRGAIIRDVAIESAFYNDQKAEVAGELQRLNEIKFNIQNALNSVIPGLRPQFEQQLNKIDTEIGRVTNIFNEVSDASNAATQKLNDVTKAVEDVNRIEQQRIDLATAETLAANPVIVNGVYLIQLPTGEKVFGSETDYLKMKDRVEAAKAPAAVKPTVPPVVQPEAPPPPPPPPPPPQPPETGTEGAGGVTDQDILDEIASETGAQEGTGDLISQPPGTEGAGTDTTAPQEDGIVAPQQPGEGEGDQAAEDEITDQDIIDIIMGGGTLPEDEGPVEEEIPAEEEPPTEEPQLPEEETTTTTQGETGGTRLRPVVVSRRPGLLRPDIGASGVSTRVTGEALAGILGEKEPLFGGDEDEQRAVWNRRSLRLRRALGL